MSKEKLQAMSKPEIQEEAKKRGISRYRQKKALSKDELIEAIMAQEEELSENKGVEVAPEATDDGNELDTQAEPAAGDVEPEAEEEVDEEARVNRHKQYVENVKVGTLVAFKTGPNKAKSAVVTKRSTKNRKLKVETKYGKEFIIYFDDVIWVHTNKRWPRGVYNMLKGKVNGDESTDKVD